MNVLALTLLLDGVVAPYRRVVEDIDSDFADRVIGAAREMAFVEEFVFAFEDGALEAREGAVIRPARLTEAVVECLGEAGRWMVVSLCIGGKWVDILCQTSVCWLLCHGLGVCFVL